MVALVPVSNEGYIKVAMAIALTRVSRNLSWINNLEHEALAENPQSQLDEMRSPLFPCRFEPLQEKDKSVSLPSGTQHLIKFMTT